MNINILGTKVHVVLVVLGTLCVLLLFGCIGVISWGGWKINQQDEAVADLKNLKNLNKTLQEETEKLSQKVEKVNDKSQNETKKLSSQIENLDEKLQEETENLNQTIQLIQKFKAFLFNEHCNYKECLPCQTGWIYFSDSCYFISNDSWSWDQSRRFCQNKAADLVVINNQQEQEFIYGKINANKLYWLGLQNYGRYVNSVTFVNYTSSVSYGSVWVWIDGRINTLRFWRWSDYDYYSYAYMYRSGNPTSSWFSAPSYSSPSPLCEQKAFKVSLN